MSVHYSIGTIRLSPDGRALMLACPIEGARGRVALGRMSCLGHIAIATDGYQHPNCIEINIIGNVAALAEVSNPLVVGRYSKVYEVSAATPTTFSLGVRWRRNHSPYPTIRDMRVWAFGAYLGNFAMPKAPASHAIVADVRIEADGTVYVNGRRRGVWPEFISQ